MTVERGMEARRAVVLFAGLALAAGVLGCAAPVPPGWRSIVMSVQNNSRQPAMVAVAVDGGTMGRAVGTADPALIPPGVTADVTFGLPPEPGWGIFVNPGPNRGPMFAEMDVPRDASGRAPFTIVVDGRGEVSATSHGPTPGWMGEP